MLENEPPLAKPFYELRALRSSHSQSAFELWQMPTSASSHLTDPKRLAILQGRNLELFEHRVIRHLSDAGLKAKKLSASKRCKQVLPEEIALFLGLMFRALAPMRDSTKMRAVVDGIEAMGREEAAYWLGMAMYRRNPRRVLCALRLLLTDPKRQND